MAEAAPSAPPVAPPVLPPDNASALVDLELLRQLRGAERPLLPDGAQPAPTTIAYVSTHAEAAPVVAAADAPQVPGSARAADALDLPQDQAREAAAEQDALPATMLPSVESFQALSATAATSGGAVGSAAPSTSSLQAPPAAAPALAAAAGAAAEAAAAPAAAPGAPPPADLPLPVADPARLALSNAATREDTPIRLSIDAALTDLDHQGGETLSIVVENMPPGATLSHGTPMGGGTWKLSPADLHDLVLTPGQDWSGEATLTVRAIVTGSQGDQKETVLPLHLSVEAVADAPALAASGTGREDTPVPLALDVRTTDIDGSESITAIAIAGVPAEATLSAGTRDGAGVWHLAPADLAGLTLTPPHDFSGTIPLVLTATSAEPNGSTASSTLPFEVHVGAVADAPPASAADSSGAEDSWVPLHGLAAALSDTDGSESLSTFILGVPDGALLSAGARQPDGSWQVPVAALGTLALHLAPDQAGDIALTLRAVSTEADPLALVPTAVTDVPFTVHVAPVVDGAAMSASAHGAEDSWITLSGTLATPADASEHWDDTLTISGLPAGAVLNQGTLQADGSWQVSRTEFQAGQVAIRPPADSDADFTLTLSGSITDSQGGLSATRSYSTDLPVTVVAVADAPHLSAADAHGREDTPIPLSLAAALADIDGSETLSLRIDGVPDGATLSAGTRQPDGSWMVPPAALAGLSLTPPHDFSGAIPLSVTATSTEARDGSVASTTLPFVVTVDPVADVGTMTAHGSGAEDSWIPIQASFTTSDIDGSETIGLITTISGVPSGATLSQGTQLPSGAWQVSSTELAAGHVSIRPPANSDADFTLTFTAQVVDHGAGTTDSRDVTTTGTITVTAVADAPTVVTANATGAEDSWIPLTGLGGALTDTDGSESLSFRISGLPSGATLSIGTHNADGSWSLTPDQLAHVSIKPPQDFSGGFDLTLTATSTEARDGNPSASSSAPFHVTVTPVADGGTMTAHGSGAEDSWIPIQASFATSDIDGSETIGPTTTISGVPAGATLNQGMQLPSGAWQVSSTELAAGHVSIRPPANSDSDFTLTFTAQVIDHGAGTTDSRDVTTTGTITVTAVADAPTVVTADATGPEDSWIPLTGLGGALTDTDGSESLSYTISGLPSGATLSIGTHNADGSWSLTPAQLATVSIKPPQDFSGGFDLRLTATSTEARDGSPSASSSAPFHVTVTPVADTGTITAHGSGAEDSWIPIQASFATRDIDGSESFGATTTISGVPSGATLSQGTQLPSGAWQVSTSELAAGHVSIRPPANSDADIALTFTTPVTDQGAGTTDTRNTTATGTIVVTAVADAPTVFAADATGSEDSWIPLRGLGGALTDTDGSETLSFRISGVPSGATLSIGTHNANGSWSLTPAQLATVSIKPPSNFSGGFDLTLTAISTEARDGSPSASTSTPFHVGVDPVADAGSIAGGGAGREDSWIPITARFATPDTDGSEHWGTTTTISGVPAGAVLSQGTDLGGGAWQVSTTELAAGHVSIRPPADSDADFSLHLSTTLTDQGNGHSDTRTITGDLPIKVTAVADAPAITVADTHGAEDSWIALPGLSAALTDTDGSETLSVVISGVPAGAALSAGTALGNGTWQVAAGDLATLRMMPPRDFSGDVHLSLAATSADHDASTATSTGLFTVRVDAVADVPILRIAPAAGHEDTPIPLTLSARTTDIDGSENIAFFRIDHIPAGAVLTTAAGTLHAEADGSVLVPAGQASSLSITPPLNSDADFSLRVSAIAREPNGSTAESPAQDLAVTVRAVADTPTGLSGGGTGHEDVPVPLNISAQLTDTDGSERLSFVVSGVPDGMSLNVGTYAGPGRWSLTADEAAHAALVTPRDWSGQVQLTLTAVAQEQDGGSLATRSMPMTVDVIAVVDAPAVGGLGGSAAHWPTASGPEDSLIALRLDPGLQDRDGSESVVGTIVIAGLPKGAALLFADGKELAPTAGGEYEIPAERMGDVVIRPPKDSDVAFELTVRMTIADSGGVQATIKGQLRVDPVGQADEPIFAVGDAAGREHHSSSPSEGWIDLPIKLALTDTDGSESARLILRDVPAGFMLSAGHNMGNGVWVLEPGQQKGLSIRPPADFSGGASITVDALVTEREGDSLRTSHALVIKVEDDGLGGGGGGGGGGGDPGPTAPDLKVALSDGREDQPMELLIAAGGGGKEVALTFVVDHLPDGASLSAGFRDPGTGNWLLTEADLPGLKLIPPADQSGAIDIHVSVIATDAIGRTASTEEKTEAKLEAVADAPVISAAPAAGYEDTPVPLHLAIAPGDRDGSEHIDAVIVSGLPDGAKLVGHGITDLGGGRFAVDPLQVGSLAVLPPANAHGSFSVTVTATSVEEANGDSATSTHTVGFSVAPVPDAPLVSAGRATGAEDSAIPLALSAQLADTDGSEVMSLVVSGLPTGAILSAGINNGNGSWTLLPSQLTGLHVTPPGDFSGTIAATVTAYAMERSTGEVAATSRTFAIEVTPVADTPLMSAPEHLAGNEDTAIALPLHPTLTDTDGSETLAVLITNVPAGASFSAGHANPDGSWTIPAMSLAGLSFTPPHDFSGTITLSVAAVATDGASTAASAAQSVTVVVAAVADAPLLSATPATGTEDHAVPLAVSLALSDTDGSETLGSVVISGLPHGFTLSAGHDNGDGTVTLAPAELAGLSLHAPANWSGALSLTATATSTEHDGGSATTSVAMPVTIAAVADAPLLSATPATGTEDHPVPLAISVALADTDGSETLGPVVIAGLPHGFTLSAGHDNGDGSVTLTQAELTGLQLHAPTDWNGTLALTATATSTEHDGGSATSTTSLAVTIAAVNDAPTLAVGAHAPVEEGAGSATVAASVGIADVDGDPVAGAVVQLGAGRQPEDAVMLQGYALHVQGGHTMIGDTGIELVGGGFDPATGQLSLSGNASPATYQAVLGALVLASSDGSALEEGDRSISIALHDPAGATATQSVTVSVTPSVLEGNGHDATLTGTAAGDTFHGSAGNETMAGNAGNDLFLLSTGGGHDTVDGGAGHDTLALSGVTGAPTGTAPVANGWQLVLDGTAQPAAQDAHSLDFSEPVSGHIVMGDGTHIDFTAIERITW